MAAVVDNQRLAAPAPDCDGERGADDDVHHRADRHEQCEQPDEVGAFGALSAKRILHPFAAGKGQSAGQDRAVPHYCWAESADGVGSRLVWVCGGVLLSSSARAPTASLGTWPDSER